MIDRTIHVKNVTKFYSGRKVVDVADLIIGEHGIAGLIGPNGAGKTTLINLISKRVTPTSGQIIYQNNGQTHELSRLRADQIARMGVVRTNQIIQDFESLTIMDSMLLALARSEDERFYKLFCDRSLRKRSEEEIAWYLDYFHFDDPYGHALSAGEKKLLDIIRCMLLKPDFLIMDEPTNGLPQDVTDRVIDMMRMKAKEGMRFLIVEHDLDLIWSVSENVFFMAEGELLLQGTPDEVRCNDLVVEKYMGEKYAEYCKYI